jgi:hypothetical protein
MPRFLTILPKGDVYKRYKMGPSSDPCGTPYNKFNYCYYYYFKACRFGLGLRRKLAFYIKSSVPNFSNF